MDTVLKIRVPLHRRVLIYAIILLSIYMLCFIGFQYKREKNYKVDMLDYRLQMVNIHLAQALEDSIDINQALEDLHIDDFKQIRFTIIDTLGRVRYDSNNNQAENSFDNHSDRPEVIAALKTGTGYTLRRLSESTQQEYFYSATLIDDMVFRSALPYDVSLREVLSAESNFIWFMIGVAAVICFFCYVITTRLGRNIERLRKFALITSRGESIEDIGDFSNDELGEISSQVVHLYTELKQTKERLEGEHKLIMMHEQEKANLKKHLTQNINHELKTPVCSIKGYLEILNDNPSLEEPKRKDFIEKSYVQVERLTNLLADISTITRMDEANELVVKTELDLSAVINDVIIETQPIIEQAGVIISSRFGSGLRMAGNQTLLHSIFANLTDKALAYSGCSMIEIRVGDDGEFYHICFSDNGNGIGKHHLDRIFDRFYRVDKGRSRKIGGTGLGLSIVKNAVLIHSGTIYAKERKGGGTDFVFTLRKL